MITSFNGNTKVRELNIREEELNVLELEEKKIVVNKKTGGWVICDDLDLLQLLSPFQLNGEIADMLYQANVIAKNGEYIFNKESLKKDHQINYYKISLLNVNERQIEELVNKVIENSLITGVKKNCIEFLNNNIEINVKALMYIINYINSKNEKRNFTYIFQLDLLRQIQPEMLQIIKENNVHISTCLDTTALNNNDSKVEIIKLNLKNLNESGQEPALYLDDTNEKVSFERLIDLGFKYVLLNSFNAQITSEYDQNINLRVEKSCIKLVNQTIPTYMEKNALIIDLNMAIILCNLLQPYQIVNSSGQLFHSLINDYSSELKDKLLNPDNSTFEKQCNETNNNYYLFLNDDFTNETRMRLIDGIDKEKIDIDAVKSIIKALVSKSI